MTKDANNHEARNASSLGKRTYLCSVAEITPIRASLSKYLYLRFTVILGENKGNHLSRLTHEDGRRARTLFHALNVKPEWTELSAVAGRPLVVEVTDNQISGFKPAFNCETGCPDCPLSSF